MRDHSETLISEETSEGASKPKDYLYPKSCCWVLIEGLNSRVTVRFSSPSSALSRDIIKSLSQRTPWFTNIVSKWHHHPNKTTYGFQTQAAWKIITHCHWGHSLIFNAVSLICAGVSSGCDLATCLSSLEQWSGPSADRCINITMQSLHFTLVFSRVQCGQKHWGGDS